MQGKARRWNKYLDPSPILTCKLSNANGLETNDYSIWCPGHDHLTNCAVQQHKIEVDIKFRTQGLSRGLTVMQPIRTIWTILVGDHPGTIPVELVKLPLAVQEKMSFEFFLI